MTLTQRLAHWMLRRARPHWMRNALSGALLEVETFAPPAVLASLPGERVLVLAPHGDDESVGCGGTVAALCAAGQAVRVVILTDGSLGSRAVRELRDSDPRKDALRAELRETRAREARAALDVLGVRQADFLDVPDGALTATFPGLAERLAAILREFAPQLILLPFPTDRHRDHAATAGCLLAALERLGQPPGPEVQWAGYEVWTPGHPNVLVDISAHAATKRAAIAAYASQTAELPLADGALALNRFRAVSGLLGDGHAEAFHLAALPVLERMHRRLIL